NGADRYRYDADFMTMRKIGLMQDFPNAEKRRLRGERAALERDVEAANLGAQRAGLRREIALAWLELYFAQQTRAPLVELVGELQLQLDTVSAAIAAGRQNTADALALRGAGVAAQDRVIEQDRTIERARYALAAWLRDDASRRRANPPDTSVFDHPPTALLANLHEHPEQRVYAEREALARTDAALAANSKKSDWSLEVAYGQRGPAFSNMISVMVSIDLPWEADKRQDRDLAAKRLLAEQAQAQTEEARRMHEAELRGFYADWQTAGVRTERFEKLLLPLARERVAAALAVYGGGRGELGAVLEARRAEPGTRRAARAPWSSIRASRKTSACARRQRRRDRSSAASRRWAALHGTNARFSSCRHVPGVLSRNSTRALRSIRSPRVSRWSSFSF